MPRLALIAALLCACSVLAAVSEQHTYDGRRYSIYVPTTYVPNRFLPAVVAFHGHGDTYSNFAGALSSGGWTQAAEDHGFLLIVPEHDNPNRDSFLSLNGSSLDVTATRNRVDAILTMIADGVRDHYEVDLTRIVFLGFSEGAHFADLAAYWRSAHLHAAVVYAGGVTGKDFDDPRRIIPLWFTTGQDDALMWPAAYHAAKAWHDAGATVNGGFPEGVAHHFTNLCGTSSGNPDDVFPTLMAAAITSLATPIPAEDETLRTVSIRTTVDGDRSWTCTPGPQAWASGDGTRFFVGLRADVDHVLGLGEAPATVAAIASPFQPDPDFEAAAVAPNGDG